MSDRVHRTVRPTLPEGYQYGDARKNVERTLFLFVPTSLGFCIRVPWRAPHENAAEQLKRNQQRTGDETL